MASKRRPAVKPKPKKLPVGGDAEDTVYENPEPLVRHESIGPSYGIPKKTFKKRSTSDISESIRRRFSNFELSTSRQRLSSSIDTDSLSDESENIYDPVALDENPPHRHVNPIKPIAIVQGYMASVPQQVHKVQQPPPEVHSGGRQYGSHSAGILKESKSFLEKVVSLYDSVKETREMYELDEVLRAVLFEGELRMFRHMDVIEETLYSFKCHLEDKLHDVVEIFKLVKKWLEMNYFDCFECYFLNVDIQQNLVSFVKKNRTAFHQILQRKNSELRHGQLKNYSFNDIEARFEEPRQWYNILTYSLTQLKEGQMLRAGDSRTLIQYEAQRLLNEKLTNLMERYKENTKHHAHHASSIIGRLEFEKNDHGLINPEVSLLVAEDYAMIQGKVHNIPSLKKSPVGKSAYPGNKAYLVVFERVVLLTTLEEDKKGNRTYRTLECCNKNYVDIEVLSKNSSTRPHTFVLYVYKPIEGSSSYSSTQYILVLIGDEIQNGPIMSDWLKAITVPEGAGIYAKWSRPRYTISQRYFAEKDDIVFSVGDEIEVIEDPDDHKCGWCYVERSEDSRKGWIPKSNLGIQQANEYKTTLDLKQQKRLERQNDREGIKKVKKNRRKTSAF